MISCGKNLFAGSATGFGISQSTDYGISWASLTNGIPKGIVEAMAVWDNKIYAYINDQGFIGMFLSTNNGATWTNISANLNFYMTSFAVVKNSSDEEIGFAGTKNGVYKSINGGLDWSAAGLPDSNITALAVIGTDLFASSNTGVYRSDDFGFKWVPAYKGLSNTGIKYLSAGKTDLFAGSIDGGVLSTNNGAEWISVNSGLYLPIALNCLAAIGSNLFSGFVNAGIFRSTDNGTTWNTANTGIMETSVSALAGLGSTVFLGTLFNLYSSTDEGLNWLSTNPFYGLNPNSFMVIDKYFFVSIGYGIYYSTNGGSSWTIPANKGLSLLNTICISGSSNESGGINLYAGTMGVTPLNNYPHGGIFISTDYGLSWNLAGLKDTAISAITCIGTNIYAATNHGTIYYSDGKTKKWEVILQVPYYISSFTTRGNEFFIGTEGGGIFRSTDGGEQWTHFNNGLSNSAQVVSCFLVRGKNIFIGTEVGVYLLNNVSSCWESINSNFNGISGNIVYALAASDSNLYAGLYNGVWRRPFSEIITDSMPGIVPYKYSLSQNYPNPFNLSTTINYSLPMRSNVIIKVYDILGREIKTLVDGDQDVGDHKVVFNSSALPSGIYIYKLKTGNFVLSKKILLVK
jgi:photosystem II stability/assembly factor-like uncharacterized protein